MIKHLLKPTYENFIDTVASNRNIDVKQLLPFTEGKIFIANMPEIKGILVDKISSLYKIKKMIRESLKDEDIEFVNIELEKKQPFLPEIKVDLNLKEIMERVQLR